MKEEIYKQGMVMDHGTPKILQSTNISIETFDNLTDTPYTNDNFCVIEEKDARTFSSHLNSYWHALQSTTELY